MSYKNRIRNIEKRLNQIDSVGLRSKFDNSFTDGNDKHLKLSEVKDLIMIHYKSNCSHNTYRSYVSSYDNLIRLTGDKDINSVSKPDLEDFKIKRSKEVNLVSVNIDIRNLKAIFNKLAELELMEDSKISGGKQFKIENKKILAIETADIVKILNSVNDEQMNQIIRFTLLTASRISEVLSIRIKDILFKQCIVNIFQQKTNCYKTIPLTNRLADLINEVLIFNNDIDQKELLESYLFYNKFKNDPYSKMRTDTVSKNFKKILRQLNLSDDFKFHSLRHTAITELLMNNVPVNVVKEIAGHKSITTTMGYSHVRSEDMKQAVNSLNY